MLANTSRAAWTVLTGLAAAAWLGAMALMFVISVMERKALYPFLLMLLGVAVTTTVTTLVGRNLAPIDTAFSIGYQAGYSDRQREERGLVVVSEERMEQRRESREQKSRGGS